MSHVGPSRDVLIIFD